MDAVPSQSGIELAPGVRAAEADLTFRFSRSGGPGGQNVNKVNTKAELRLNPGAILGLSERARARLLLAAANRLTSEGELLIVSDSERTQERNRAECMERLRQLIVSIQKDPKVRRRTKPSRSAKERRLESKRAHSQIKQQRSQRFE